MKILIGKIVKPQGINGEVKLVDYTDGYTAVKKIERVYIDDVEYKVLSLSSRDGAIFMCLRGVFDRNAAELLRGKDVYADKEMIQKSADSFFIEDVIGCKLYLSSGKCIGEIVDVTNASTDVFTVKSIDGRYSFPFLKSLEPSSDFEKKVMTVDAKRFTEVAFFEEGGDED